ncbi:hypothetical protein ACHAPV_005125 [Trichoderma viride]
MRVISFLALVGAAIALPATESAKAAPPSRPMPDINAIKAVPQEHFTSYQTGGLKRQTLKSAATKTKRGWTCSTSPILTWGDSDTGGKGVTITNADTDWRGFYIYHNNCDTVPWKYIWIGANQTEFVSFPDGFEGRIQRGVDQYMLNGQAQWLGSWFEVSWDGNGVGWSDVSLIRGCDGGILTWGLDPAKAWKGFTQWILDGAPTGAYDMKNDGQWVLKATEGLDGSINTASRDWELQKVGSDYVYVDDYHGNPVIASSNGRFGTYWPGGRA